jgi:hypothetical protein
MIRCSFLEPHFSEMKFHFLVSFFISIFTANMFYKTFNYKRLKAYFKIYVITLPGGLKLYSIQRSSVEVKSCFKFLNGPI